MVLGMITVFVNVMTKGSIMEVMNQKIGKNDNSIVFYAILGTNDDRVKLSKIKQNQAKSNKQQGNDRVNQDVTR